MRTEPSFSAEPDHNSLTDGARSGLNANVQFDPEAQILSDYRQRYGLSVDPFTDDPHFPFYTGAQRRQVLEQLLHLCQFSHNLLLITGSYGVGKTRMAQALIDSLDDADDICFVEGQITSDINSLLADVFAQFELPDSQEFTEFCKKSSEQDGLVVLIIDNAHHLADDVLLGLLGVLQESQQSRLHVVLFSEPHLLERLAKIDVPGLVFTDVTLEKLSLNETVDYLNFRMEMADYLGPEIFVESKVEPWWRQAQGQLSVLHECAQEKLLSSVSLPRNFSSNKSNQLVPHIVATSLLVGGLLFAYLYFGGGASKDVNSARTISAPATPLVGIPNVSTDSITAGGIVPSVDQNTDSKNTSSALVDNESNPVTHQVEAAVEQHVVPLVQTNTLENNTSSKRVAVSVPPPSKEVKKIVASSAPSATPTPETNKRITPALVQQPLGLSSQEKSILSWDGSDYTLQLVGLSNEKSALEFIAMQPNKKDLFLFRSVRKGKDWFVVVAGHYATSAKARQALQGLPESQKKASPWAREVAVIQGEIKQR